MILTTTPASRELRGRQGSLATQLIPYSGSMNGVTLTVGTSAWGGWHELGTAPSWGGFLVGFTLYYASSADFYALSFGYGATGAEVPMAEWQGYIPSSSTYSSYTFTLPVPAPFPAGRLAVRGANRYSSYALYGLYAIVAPQPNIEY